MPDLPGCVATGKTVADVEQGIRAAIRFHIDGLREDMLPVPELIEPADILEFTFDSAPVVPRRAARRRRSAGTIAQRVTSDGAGGRRKL